MDDDSDDDSLPSGRGRVLRTGTPVKTWAERWEGVKALFSFAVVLGILGGTGYGIYAGAIWVNEQYFDSAASVGKRADKCWEATKQDPLRLPECVKLSERADALQKREQADSSARTRPQGQGHDRQPGRVRALNPPQTCRKSPDAEAASKRQSAGIN